MQEVGVESKQELLFLKKRAPRPGKQKNFCESGTGAVSGARAQINKSFLLLFFKKEVLACLLFASPCLALAAPPLTVTKPWVRYLLPSVPAAGYMTVRNDGDTDAVLTGASSPSCGMVMLHKSEDSSGMAMMMDMQTITIPAHGSVTFQPGGYHLMCMSPAMKLGDTVKLTLSFQDAPAMTVAAPVYGAQGAP
jgi:copper(I)-binding protein